MDIQFELDGRPWRADLSLAKSLAICQTFGVDQPNHFGVPDARRRPVRAGQFIGSTVQGGSCNVDELYVIPHCNGTHTESCFHVVDPPEEIPPIKIAPLMLAQLVSLPIELAEESGESYEPELQPGDRIITAQSLNMALAGTVGAAALIIRTLPNSTAKRHSRYSVDSPPPFLSVEAIDWIANRFEHLLVDIPSIDRMYDEGRLVNHHRFWGIPPGSHYVADAASQIKSVTEMIFVEDSIPDGHYLLNLQIPVMATDAVPSRPVIFPAIAQ